MSSLVFHISYYFSDPNITPCFSKQIVNNFNVHFRLSCVVHAWNAIFWMKNIYMFHRSPPLANNTTNDVNFRWPNFNELDPSLFPYTYTCSIKKRPWIKCIQQVKKRAKKRLVQTEKKCQFGQKLKNRTTCLKIREMPKIKYSCFLI